MNQSTMFICLLLVIQCLKPQYTRISQLRFFLFDMIKPNGYPLGCESPTGMGAGLVSCPSRFTGTGFVMGQFFAQPVLNLPIPICTHM
jgi:hypothetical protein